MALLQQGGTAVAGVEGTAELYSLEGSGETQQWASDNREAV